MHILSISETNREIVLYPRTHTHTHTHIYIYIYISSKGSSNMATGDLFYVNKKSLSWHANASCCQYINTSPISQKVWRCKLFTIIGFFKVPPANGHNGKAKPQFSSQTTIPICKGVGWNINSSFFNSPSFFGNEVMISNQTQSFFEKELSSIPELE